MKFAGVNTINKYPLLIVYSVRIVTVVFCDSERQGARSEADEHCGKQCHNARAVEVTEAQHNLRHQTGRFRYDGTPGRPCRR